VHQFSDLIDFLPQSTILLLGISLITLTLTVFNFLSRLNCKFIYYGLFISVLLAGFGFALIDNFLHPWDEQFHALVAKNMISDPFHPVLINKIPSEFDYRIWVYNETWLHKQPLFLWQISVSLKLFGTNLIALRLPSIIMYALTSCCVFSISKRFLNPFFAILAAAFFGYCGFALDFISGVQGMDHNDIAFLFYITASFWSWMKYNETKNFRYVMLIGLFSGGAVLCKWLTGLIVFTGWGIVTFAFNIKEKREWKNIFSAFGVCLLVFLPWQLYCLVNYPLEYKYEIAYNSAHFFSTVENHGGSSDFYFEGMKKIYGGGHLMHK
jgi:4-amino-4-deoxy-L-arabinose transferase